MGVAVAAQRGAQAGPLGRAGARPSLRGGLARPRRLVEQPGQVVRLLARDRLGDHLGGGAADPRQRAQRALAGPLVQLRGGQFADHLGRPAERPHPVGGRARPFQLERDLAQRLQGIHLPPIPSATPAAPIVRASGRPAHFDQPGPVLARIVRSGARLRRWRSVLVIFGLLWG